VMSHMVKDPPVGCGWCIAKTGCSARIRANSGAGLIGSSGSRCERGQDSGSDEVVITNDNTSGRRKTSGSTWYRASLDKEAFTRSRRLSPRYLQVECDKFATDDGPAR
jgi:hypothetical protein